MHTRIATHHFFNPETQRALLEHGDGYVSKEEGMRDRLAFIEREYKPEHIALLHLGQNPDGCAPELVEWARDVVGQRDVRKYFADYPESLCNEFQLKLSALHNVPRECITVSAGLDQLIAMIASSFIEQRDKFLVTSPGFFLFEEYSCRLGGVPVELNLQESDGFIWTNSILETFRGIVQTMDLKLIWIANPNNPTGRLMPGDLLEEIIRIARSRWITVVIDEAYGEYTDPSMGINSASRFLSKYENLIVLRTFSKAYGLAGLRIAYSLTCNSDILSALRVHSQYYPVARLSLDMANRALDFIGYLDKVRHVTKIRRETLSRCIFGMQGISLLNSDSGIGMLRCDGIAAADLSAGLEREGVIVAPVPGSGVAAREYIRLTYGRTEDLSWLARGVGIVISKNDGF